MAAGAQLWLPVNRHRFPGVVGNQSAVAGLARNAVLFPCACRRVVVRDVAHEAGAGLALLGPVLNEDRVRSCLAVRAMLPFCGYNMADYFGHWLNVGRRVPNPPRIFRVNWFRKDEQGKFLWPGFGENMRVLKWIVDRLHGRGYAVESPIGWMPRHEDLEWKGLNYPADTFYELMAVGREAGAKEAHAHEEQFDKFFDRLPKEFIFERELLRSRLWRSPGSTAW